MNYARARDLIKTGDLLAWSGGSFVGRFIRAFTNSSYSHVGLALWIEEGETKRLLVAESREGKGVQIIPLSEQQSFDAVLLGGSSYENKLREFAWKKTGKAKYDWSSIAKRALGMKMSNNGKYTCNEFGQEGLIVAGLIPPDSYAGDPHTLVEIAKEQDGASLHRVTT